MLHQFRLFAGSILVIAAGTFIGCAGGANPTETTDEEDLGSAKQAAIASGYYRTYYTDSSYGEAVGWEDYDCDPNYRFLEGDKTRHWKQTRYNCPEFNNPLLPSCELCNTYTTSGTPPTGGQTITSCTPSTCPIVW